MEDDALGLVKVLQNISKGVPGPYRVHNLLGGEMDKFDYNVADETEDKDLLVVRRKW